MREQLIKLAKEKGFEMFIDNFENQIDNSIIYYLILCELQKWLIDEYHLFVRIAELSLKKWSFMLIQLDIDGTTGKGGNLGRKNYKTYTDSLEDGCFEALKLIK